MRIRDWPAGEGPRERLLRLGAGALSDAELLALLFGTGRAGCNALDLAREVLQSLGGLSGVLAAPPPALMAIRGVGVNKFANLQGALELARRSALEPLTRGELIASPEAAGRFLALHLGAREREVFTCVFLDTQHRVLRCEDLFLGTLDGAAVYPREVAVRALEYRAAAVILAHNHPSGVAEPSGADRRITERLQQALGLLDIRVLDHVIVGQGTQYSFAQSGLL